MSLDLGQEPLDRHGHQLGATEAGHVTEDMGRVEPLPGDVEFERLSQPGGHVVEDLGGQVVVAKEFLVASDGARRDGGTQRRSRIPSTLQVSHGRIIT